jgi:hypothetical protein
MLVSQQPGKKEYSKQSLQCVYLGWGLQLQTGKDFYSRMQNP